MMVGKQLLMFLDERDDIIHLLVWRLETPLAIRRDDKLVATHSLALVIHAHIRRIAQAVPSIQLIARILQHILYVYPIQEIIVCQFSIHIHLIRVRLKNLLSVLSVGDNLAQRFLAEGVV